ncbi:hypothetical protein GH714_025999 [Hevea brasiliensis]|uniref:PARP-type domain-containing protein n=1 Tax=Hevea brasiliensis TaxID=3981 RepID=A0A6A6MKV8_HEVBR|nr:hypothetical protein GH714_025999 [Hevea brasiliensis]
MPPSSKARIVAEYAKSNRSSCKKCSQVISAKALRLGFVTRDSRGFDMTKWHHLDCFSETIESTEAIGEQQDPEDPTIAEIANLKLAKKKQTMEDARIQILADHLQSLEQRFQDVNQEMHNLNQEMHFKIESHTKRLENLIIETQGKSQEQLKCKFDQLLEVIRAQSRGNEPVLPTVRQTRDQEALKKLMSELKSSVTDVSNARKDAIEGSPKSFSKRTNENVQEVELEERNFKKNKLAMANEEGELEIAFSPSDIMEKYKDAVLLPKWKAFQTLIFLERDDGLHDSNKIAAFDFDGCLAKTSVKRVGADAWSLMYPSIPDKLQSLYNDGYKLVIFTNESNIDRWKNKRQIAVDSKVGRLNNFIEHVKVPIQVFIACGYSHGNMEDPFRKPKPGMWWIMEKHFNSGISIDMDNSFYVGDAAGRIDDHSDTDIKFAQCPDNYITCLQFNKIVSGLAAHNLQTISHLCPLLPPFALLPA